MCKRTNWIPLGMNYITTETIPTLTIILKKQCLQQILLDLSERTGCVALGLVWVAIEQVLPLRLPTCNVNSADKSFWLWSTGHASQKSIFIIGLSRTKPAKEQSEPPRLPTAEFFCPSPPTLSTAPQPFQVAIRFHQHNLFRIRCWRVWFTYRLTFSTERNAWKLTWSEN